MQPKTSTDGSIHEQLKKRKNPLGIQLVSGLTGCSKTTIIQIALEFLPDFTELECDRLYLPVDTSAFLDISKGFVNGEQVNQPTLAGRELIKMEADRIAGKVLDAGPVKKSIEENLHRVLKSYPYLIGIGIAGSTRGVEESYFWLEFDKIRQSLINATPEQIRKSIDGRVALAVKKGKKVRPDEGKHAFANKMTEFETKIIPGIDVWPQHLVSRDLHRSMPLLERVKKMVHSMHSSNPEHSVISDDTLQDWLAKLENPEHPVHTAIKTVERGGEIPAYRPLVKAFAQRAHLSRRRKTPPGGKRFATTACC